MAFDGVVSGGTVSGGTVSGGTVSGGTVSGGAALGDEDEAAVPSMRLYTFRLSPELIERIDALADRDRKRRADLVREALTRYVEERTAPVAQDEAERALEVLRRVVSAQPLSP